MKDIVQTIWWLT